VDKLAGMRAFVEIVDRGSLTAAAEAAGKSLPTMVRTLAALEAALGARLLRRTTRRMSLTAEGRDYLERCRRILSDVEEAELALAARSREPRGELRVTAPVLFGQMHVAPAVVEFVEQHRSVSVDLQLIDRIVDLVDEGIDAAVRIAQLPDSSQIAIPVGTMRRVLVASPTLLARTGTPERPEALASQPCVGFGGLSPGHAWRFHERGRELIVNVRCRFASNQGTAALDACAAGLGFGSFLCYQVEPHVAAGRLRVVLQEFEPTPVPVSLVHSEARLVSTRLRVFLDWMKQRLRNRRILAD
jgi:DNA-binding transcriptional LysR family regulator